MLIFFEGLDGCGKTTYLHEIKLWLEDEHNLSVADFRDPGGTEMAEEIRKIVKSARHAVKPATRFLMFVAARSELMEAIKRAEEEEDVVLIDRWWFSTFAYQGADGISQELIFDTTAQLTNLPYDPNLAFYFVAANTYRRARKRKRGDAPGMKGTGEPPVHKDHYDEKDSEFQSNVEANYSDLIHCGYLNWINANGTVEEVVQALQQRITPYLPNRKDGGVALPYHPRKMVTNPTNRALIKYTLQ